MLGKRNLVEQEAASIMLSLSNSLKKNEDIIKQSENKILQQVNENKTKTSHILKPHPKFRLKMVDNYDELYNEKSDEKKVESRSESVTSESVDSDYMSLGTADSISNENSDTMSSSMTNESLDDTKPFNDFKAREELLSKLKQKKLRSRETRFRC